MTKFIGSSETPDIDSIPSKSQRKREMKELQKLGKQIVESPDCILKNIEMEEELSNAILLARRLGKDGSKRRQLQYIGKLLSQTDIDQIKQVLDTSSLQKKNANNLFHHIEKWRDKLVKNGSIALNDLINEHPNLDRQHLRQLIRNTQKESSLQKPPTSSRAIFCYLRDNIKNSETSK